VRYGLSELEIERAKQDYTDGRLDLDTLENVIDGWLKWEEIDDPVKRREFELAWEAVNG
jgi:hypothetical protein